MGATTFFKYNRGESLFMTTVERLFINWPERHNLGPGWQFLDWRAHITEALGQGV